MDMHNQCFLLLNEMPLMQHDFKRICKVIRIHSFGLNIQEIKVKSNQICNVFLEDCPGTGSEDAGKASACQGCPNQATCSSLPKGPDPGILVSFFQYTDKSA